MRWSRKVSIWVSTLGMILVEIFNEGMKHREADTGKVVDKAEVGKTYYPHGRTPGSLLWPSVRRKKLRRE